MKLPNKQEDPVALVTGGARRIGAAIVRKLHSAGFRVVIHCRNALQEAHDLAKELNQLRSNSAFVIQRELLEEHAAAEVIATAIEWAQRLDVLVNNASIFPRTDCTASPQQNWDEIFNANAKAPFLLSLAACSYLSKQQGVIINQTDIHADKPLKGYSVYCQSKAALVAQTKSLAQEFAPQIRVNAIAPGAIIWPEAANSLSPEDQQQIINRTPLKRHGDPEHIAQATLALIQNPFITGQILNVDGGRSLVD